MTHTDGVQGEVDHVASLQMRYMWWLGYVVVVEGDICTCG